MSVISMVLVVIVAFLAGMEGVLDEFQFHHPLVAGTLMGLVTGQRVPCNPISSSRIILNNDRSYTFRYLCSSDGCSCCKR